MTKVSAEKIAQIADGSARETSDDYVGLWQIATRVRREFGPLNNEDTKKYSLDVVRRMLEHGIRPGDYFKIGFKFWDEDDSDLIISRIDTEWDPVCGDPTLVDPICWFSRKVL